MYIAQAIEDTNFKYEVFDLNTVQSHAIVLEFIKAKRPKFVGISTMTHRVQENYAFINKVKEAYPEVQIIMGGPHTLAAEESIFEECKGIDIIVKGEGEKAIVDILKGTKIPDIPGASTRFEQGPPHIYLELSTISFPKNNKFNMEHYGKTIRLASSRGCIYNCAFCCAPKFLGRKWRKFSAEHMIKEFEYWYFKGYRKFSFDDSLLLLDKQRMLDFCFHIQKNNYTDASFIADGTRADHITLELARAMKSAGFVKFNIGVESIHDKSLQFLSKGTDQAQIEKALEILDELGMPTQLMFIIGIPGESYEDMLASLLVSLKYKCVMRIALARLTPILGTSYYEYALEHNLIKNEKYYPDRDDFFDTSASEEVTKEQFESLFEYQNQINASLEAKHRAYL